MVGTIENEVVATPLSEVAECTRHVQEADLDLARVLAR